MPCRSIADVLRRLGEIPPSDMTLVADGLPEPPVAPERWLGVARISAARARDVVERRDDDRSRAERRELYARTLGAAKLARPPVFRFGAQVKAKSKSAPRPKRERTEETRAYFRDYMRERRARARDKMAEVEVRHE
jgi:hypothetical protein